MVRRSRRAVRLLAGAGVLSVVAGLAGPVTAASALTGPGRAGAGQVGTDLDSTGEAGAGRAGAGRADPVARELQAALDAAVEAGVTGVTLRVDDGARSYRLASGKARLEPSLALRPGARVRVGSITKTFVATVVLQLVDEGRLGLDDTVEKWLPGQIPNGAGITVRQLLNHTSGLFNYTEDEDFILRVLSDPLKAVPPRELLEVSNAHPPVFAPGTNWSYSNTNYVALGLILEKVTRRPASEIIEQRIVRPLLLSGTYLPERSAKISGYHARGYWPPSISGEGYLDVTEVHPSWAWTAGALVSTTDDLRRFYSALLGGRLLRPARLAEMKTLVPLGEVTGYGLGLYRTETPCGNLWGHDGGVPGYITVALNDESGRRGLTLSFSTDLDESMLPAYFRLMDVAACTAVGRPVPPSSGGTARTTAPAQDWSRLLLDRAPWPTRS